MSKASSWYSAKLARRGSTASACTMKRWRASHSNTSARSASLNCGEKSSGTYMLVFPRRRRRRRLISTMTARAWSSKHTRHSSSHSHSLSHSHPPLTPTVATVPRTSRSHSPAVSKTTKRRNTMNSRDAAYDEEKFQALIDIPRTDHDLPPRTPVSSVSAQGGLNGHTDPAPDMEATTNPKKKRKRTDDDV